MDFKEYSVAILSGILAIIFIALFIFVPEFAAIVCVLMLILGFLLIMVAIWGIFYCCIAAITDRFF